MIILKEKGIVVMLGVLIGTVSQVSSAILPVNENTMILETGEAKGITILGKGILPELALEQDKVGETTELKAEWRVVREDIIGREETDTKTLRLRINKREADQFENIREEVEERDYPIQIARNLIPRVDLATSILKLIRYVEIKDIEGMREKDQYEELGVEEIVLANKRENLLDGKTMM